MHLDDLIPQGEEIYFQHFNTSESQLNFVPELKQF